MQGGSRSGSLLLWFGRPWPQLITGIVCMAMIANLQYGWTLFVGPIDAKYHWGRPAIQVVFTVFVFAETWLVPVKSWFVDRHSPRLVVAIGGVLVTIAWVINSRADTLALFYLAAGIGGAGAAAVYGSCVGNALKWFPLRRGMAAGFTAAGFGAGSALTVVPIAHMIEAAGYERTFLFFGVLQGAVILIAAIVLKAPSAAQISAGGRRRNAGPDSPPHQVIRTPVFWVMYLCFVMIAAGGLVAAAQIGPIAKDFGLDDRPVSLLMMTLPTLTFAISLDRIADGFGRPLFGYISDHIGREETMALAFTTAAIALFVFDQFGRDPLVFVLSSALFFFVFGEIYSLFPATCGDTFGARYATTNAGMLYTAKGAAALLVPLASLLSVHGNWHPVFRLSMMASVAAAVVALFVLRPLRRRLLADRMAAAGMPAPTP